MISVIIPTIHHTDLVKRCIQSFIDTVDGIPYEIIIVDDGSPPHIQEELANWTASTFIKSELANWAASTMQVQFIPKLHNEGFSRTVNIGIQHAEGDSVLLVNNDVFFHEPEWLNHMITTMYSEDNIGIVGARLLYPNMKIQHGGIVRKKGGDFNHRYRGLPANHPPALVVEDVHAVTGALMLIRRQLLDQIGLLSEEFFIAFEDVDLCYRTKQHKTRVVYCGTTCAIHAEGYTRGNSKKNKNPYWRRKEIEAKRKFWKKWRGVII